MSMRISHQGARRRQIPQQLIRLLAALLVTLRLKMFAAGRTIVVITKKLIAIGATHAIIPQTVWNNWIFTFHGTMTALPPKVAHLLLQRGGVMLPTLPVVRLERLPDRKLLKR